MDANIEQAIKLFRDGAYSEAFEKSIEILTLDFTSKYPQYIAIAVIKGTQGNLAKFLLQRWIEGCHFGNLSNAALIIRDTFDDSDVYLMSSSLAGIAANLGDHVSALELFGNCLTEDLSVSLSKQDVVQEYEQEATIYDSQPVHCESINDFMEFLGRSLGPAGDMTVIDIPCGTGQAGTLLRPWAAWLIGSDLSPDMLACAEATGSYDQLICGDLFDILPGLSANMVVCLGSLYYFQDLDPVVAAAVAALQPGGYFAFTDFPASRGVMRTIGGNMRYCRAPALVRETLAAHNFIEVSAEFGQSFGLLCIYWLFRKGPS
ncbi:MAG: methyltransferase domain-containing protein [Phaeospirillum sp.]|nr:methyltransferase domain-containing protein [Phaeospirillum sp.]